MRRERRIITILVTAVAALGGTAVGASSAPADTGTEDFSYAPLGGSPTQTKPESKLWFNDGAWWATMFSPAAGAHRIHRLVGTGWADTGTTLDARNGANADVLWHAASNKLYVASHEFTETNRAASPGEEGRLYRYSYDPGTDSYSPDAGFPVAINGAHTESLVIDMDSTGRLWATWTQDGRVYVNHTDGNDASWGTPFVLPGSTAVDVDDLSALVAFGDNRIGVMWSNQLDGRFWFAAHADGSGDADWSTGPIPSSPLADDHVSLRADGAGRVFAAVKTSDSTGPQPLTLLLRRNVNGTWNRATFGTVSDSHTRPIVVLQEPGNEARVYATCPQPPATSGQSGGDICEKRTSLSSLSFPAGRGTTVISDTGIADMNDATSTKQPVSSATGLVVMANNSNDFVNTYWHTSITLTGPAPGALVGDLGAAPTAGNAPLTVQFADRSTGSPRSWSWDFGDGATSSARNPVHTYTRPGTYTVRLTVATTTGRSTGVRTGLVTVTGSAPSTGGAGGGGAPVPRPGTTPDGAVAGTTVRRLRITLFKRNLSGRRVRLSGSVAPRLNGVRVTLQRRSSTGRWSNLRTTRLRSFTRTRSRFAFVVKRLSKTVGYRIVVPAAEGRARTLSGSLKVKRRS
jgi:trimeric autotransporter adhesin